MILRIVKLDIESSKFTLRNEAIIHPPAELAQVRFFTKACRLAQLVIV